MLCNLLKSPKMSKISTFGSIFEINRMIDQYLMHVNFSNHAFKNSNSTLIALKKFFIWKSLFMHINYLQRPYYLIYWPRWDVSSRKITGGNRCLYTAAWMNNIEIFFAIMGHNLWRLTRGQSKPEYADFSYV